ncbi:MAG: c-type cytochrome [Verrucomicrobia bacterium]|nr:c-type cytochrome [Verrucomicrobiota bacterium]
MLSTAWVSAAEVNPPTLTDPRLEISLFAAEPDIVTPIGIAVDSHGRIFVVESHTHFPKPDYPGPKFDRVKMFQDTKGTGKPDKISIFADGFYHAMNLAFASNGDLYLSHRNGVIALHDRDGDGVSESRTTILQMNTPGDYPHDGIGSMTFSPDGWLYVGLGENLGEKYTLRGSDGSSHSGGGEGGNIFRCRLDGSHLELVATGFWNPFATAFNRSGHLFAVDNDPDSRPPCRLLDVVEGGDYGFKFRYGRSGLHPFVAWNGELPGTLPMMSGTGEAPSGLLDCNRARLPREYADMLLVTSWGDHYLEAYRPVPLGASLRAERKILAQGDQWFRPVGIATGPDGVIYITDWVDHDYSVHGKGRIWRLTVKPGVAAQRAADKPEPVRANPARSRMLKLLRDDAAGEYAELERALSDNDPFIRSAAVYALTRPVYREKIFQAIGSNNPGVRLGALLVLRRARYDQPVPILDKLLADPDPQVRLIAVVWTGEEKLTALASRLNGVLSAGPVSPLLFQAYAAAAQFLAKANPASATATASAEQQLLSNPSASAAVQALVLDMEAKADDAGALAILTAAQHRGDVQLRIEAVRSLAASTNAQVAGELKAIALDRRNAPDLRAEAVLALANRPAAELEALAGLLNDPAEPVRVEVARAFRMVALDAPIRRALEKAADRERLRAGDERFNQELQIALHPPGTAAAASDPRSSGRQSAQASIGTDQSRLTSAATLGSGSSASADRPASDEDWRKALAGPGDVKIGRRVFFSPVVGCARCHRIEGRGGQVGPDLSVVAIASGREKLMQSILHPSLDIAPQFVTHEITTRDQQTYAGVLAGIEADGSVTLMTADGKGMLIPGKEIVSNVPSKTSLMPEGLAAALTVQDFRDLMAFLLSRI